MVVGDSGFVEVAFVAELIAEGSMKIQDVVQAKQLNLLPQRTGAELNHLGCEEYFGIEEAAAPRLGQIQGDIRGPGI